MPVLMTDEMIKKMCGLERPMDMRSIGILNPARNKEGYKPKYITDKKMEGIKYTELPTYAPANVRGLIGAIKNNSKVAEPIIEKYLETSIEREIGKYKEVEIIQKNGDMSIIELDDDEQVIPVADPVVEEEVRGAVAVPVVDAVPLVESVTVVNKDKVIESAISDGANAFPAQ